MSEDFTNDLLPVVEIFASVQGEGFYSGYPATFVRIAGCDVGCSWCDSLSSWKADNHPKISVNEIVLKVESYGLKRVIITGGEPLLYNLEMLTGLLNQKGFQLHLETSGVYALSGKWDWICISPKLHKLPECVDIFEKANELKIVITGDEDLIFAEKMRKKVKKSCKLFLQPEFTESEAIIPLIYKYVLENPYWNISLQMHKFMNVP
ncbi:MAG: 7-carboxy-7-deazaguanine synthase QueE [Bacteroidales bacterium]|nr:7-carboxy-7-deazaguanine synthase QueE [Bacteroidales bacterium]